MYRNKGLCVFFIIILVISNNCTASDNTFYISPGLRIGWEFGGGLTICPQLALGISIDLDDDKNHNLKYLNITLGIKNFIIRTKDATYDSYCSLQLKAGYQPFLPSSAIGIGGGIGVAFFREEKLIYLRPIATVEGTILFVAFPTIDIFLLKQNKVHADFGILGLFPIPLEKNGFGIE
ncbi:MAG: hypothetical protein R6V04_07270 [bacterium]